MAKNNTSNKSKTTSSGTATPEFGYMTQAQIDALYAPYRTAAVMPPAGYVPGVSGEINYFPAAAAATPAATTPAGNLTQYTDLSKLLDLFHGVRKGKSNLTPEQIQGYGSQLTGWSGSIPNKLKSRYNRYVDWYKGQTFANGGMAGYAAGGVPNDNFRLVRGPGGPKEDKIPARVNRTVEARLSDGEVVFPADTVKAAGNGDPTRGAKALMQLSDALRGSKQRQLEIEKVKKRK